MGLDNRGTRIGEIPTPGQPQSSPPQNAHLRMSRGGGAGEGFGGFVHGGQAWADVALETAQALVASLADVRGRVPRRLPRPSPRQRGHRDHPRNASACCACWSKTSSSALNASLIRHSIPTKADTTTPTHNTDDDGDEEPSQVFHCVEGVISPLLANVALSVLNEYFTKTLGVHRRARSGGLPDARRVCPTTGSSGTRTAARSVASTHVVVSRGSSAASTPATFRGDRLVSNGRDKEG
jgi:hypothetical protein